MVEMGKSSEGITFALESVGGPRMQLFTRSFSGLEQRFRQEVTQSGGEDAIPLIAPGAGGFVELRGRSGDTTRVLTIGQNECEGELTTAFAVRVTRLR